MSIAATVPVPHWSGTVAATSPRTDGETKAAPWSLTNSLRLEFAPRGVSVVGVHVGFVDTDLTANFPGAMLPAHDVDVSALDALEAGAPECLVDEMSTALKQALSGPVERLTPKR